MTTPLISALTKPAQVLVTGASSGIGLALVEQLLARADIAQVFAVSRGAPHNQLLAALQSTHGGRLRPLAADLTVDADLDALATRVREHKVALHLVCSAAGLLHASGLRPGTSVAQLRREALAQVFAVKRVRTGPAGAGAAAADAAWAAGGAGIAVGAGRLDRRRHAGRLVRLSGVQGRTEPAAANAKHRTTAHAPAANLRAAASGHGRHAAVETVPPQRAGRKTVRRAAAARGDRVDDARAQWQFPRLGRPGHSW